jgi:hypothetical protein
LFFIFSIVKEYHYDMQQRRNSRYKSVTLPILMPCGFDESDGFANFLPGEDQFNPVRGLGDDDLNVKTKRGKRMWDSLNSDQRKLFQNVVTLKQALDARDGMALQKAYENLASALIVGKQPPQRVRGYARFMAKQGLQRGSGSVERHLAQLLTNAVSDVKFVSWYFDDGGVLLPAVYCPHPATALFVQAVFRLQEALANRGICRWCGKVFKRSRLNQKDCTRAHGAAYRMAKKRKKDASSRKKTS